MTLTVRPRMPRDVLTAWIVYEARNKAAQRVYAEKDVRPRCAHCHRPFSDVADRDSHEQDRCQFRAVA